MSTLETNNISKYSGNNISVDDALKLKGYTTSQRNGLTSVAGDVVYNSETGTIDYYNGSNWYATSGNTFLFDCSYLVIAGGASGGRAGNSSGSGGGGAGGYRNSFSSETSGDNSSLYLFWIYLLNARFFGSFFICSSPIAARISII